MNKHAKRSGTGLPAKILAGGLICALILPGLAGCGGKTESQPVFAAENPVFAEYKEPEVRENPQIKPYKVSADLSNVENAGRFNIDAPARQKLAENGFVVTESYNDQFFSGYENNRYNGVPNLVTVDSMLHNYHLFFSFLLKNLEKSRLSDEVKSLSEGMLKASQKQYGELKGTPWENAALRNIAFFAVGGALMDPDFKIPQEVGSVVEKELTLIKNKSGMAPSPVINLGRKKDSADALLEDYSQYVPRGHYAEDPALEAYFKTMMWYGRIAFRTGQEDEARSALLMGLACGTNENMQRWENIYSTTGFFAGLSDDPGCAQILGLAEEVYGKGVTTETVVKESKKWKEFLEKAASLKGPSINSIPVFNPEIQPDREAVISGFRFMGQRYTIDADIFQRLIYREVEADKEGNLRSLPKALDIPAALGSAEAEAILKAEGDTEYKNYPENLKKLREHVGALEEKDWHQNLYWGWMNSLRTLVREVPDGYPSFMLNQAWARKELNSFIGSWTELKHDTVLYSKQVYAEMGGGGMMEEEDTRGYVEPNPMLYARIAALSAMTREGLQARGYLDPRDVENLERFETLALDLKTISEKELENKDLTADEYELIKSYGGQLEHFWMETLRNEKDQGYSALLENHPAMLVTDVATDPGAGRVLQEGNGNIQDLYAVVPVGGKLRIAKGGIYSTYEFSWDMNDRLTDRKWREMVRMGEIPVNSPAWTSLYRTSGTIQIIYQEPDFEEFDTDAESETE